VNDAPINLNRFRKDRARAEERRKADANSVLHGRTKAQRTLEKAAQDKANRELDAHKRDDA